MRGYGIPQAMWAVECHTEDICAKLNMDPLEFRRKNLMPVGYKDAFSKNELYSDTFNQCLDKGIEVTDYLRKYKEYQNQTGDIRRGIGMAVFWYNTAVWPISLETSSCRMVLNQDGSLQVQLGETEIGQGADTAYSQMTADILGVPLEAVHVVSCQDTDVTPFGTGAYASRQTYTAGFSIRQTALLLKERILKYAHELTRMPEYNLDIIDGQIVRITDNRVLMSLGDLSTEALYSLSHSEHLSAESTAQIKSNAYSFGCTFAEVEVDIPMCKVKLLDIVNVHDAGTLINPALAEAQVHGGMSMGIGFGLSENLLFDPKTGRALNNNLLDYKLSTFMDHPRLRAYFVENAEPTSAFGTKSLGEPPTCSIAPAIRNAVYQATGVYVNDAPVNPHHLFRSMKEQHMFEAESVAHAIQLLQEHPEAQIIAGGSDVLVQMREGRRAGKELVSIYKIDEMRGISYEEDGAIRIGSLTSFSHITKDPIIQKHINVLGEAVDMVGGPQIRNIGTIGGNTCNGVTSADSASTLHAWDASFRRKHTKATTDITLNTQCVMQWISQQQDVLSM